MQTLSEGEFGPYHDTKYTIVIWLDSRGTRRELGKYLLLKILNQDRKCDI